jgi:hypothetical protein
MTAPVVPIAKQLMAALWCLQHVRPMVANIASTGHIDGVKAMDIMEGLEGIPNTLAYIERNLDAIRAATSRR